MGVGALTVLLAWLLPPALSTTSTPPPPPPTSSSPWLEFDYFSLKCDGSIDAGAVYAFPPANAAATGGFSSPTEVSCRFGARHCLRWRRVGGRWRCRRSAVVKCGDADEEDRNTDCTLEEFLGLIKEGLFEDVEACLEDTDAAALTDAVADGHDRSALSYAIGLGKFDVANILVDSGADVNTKTTGRESGITPLHLVSGVEPDVSDATSAEELAAALLRAGAEVDARDVVLRTPLWYAAFHGRAGVARLLVASGADLEARDGDHHKLLVTPPPGSGFGSVRRRGDDASGVKPLFAAAQEGHLDVVKLLLESGADPVSAREDGTTALGIAMAQGGDDRHLDIVKTLIEAGADFSLHQLSTRGRPDLVEAALASPKSRDADLVPAMHEALDPRPEVARSTSADRRSSFLLLLRAHLARSPRRELLDSLPGLLEAAASVGFVRGADVLLRTLGRLRPEHDELSSAVNRALYRASYSGHLDAVRLLVSRGDADVDFVQESESDNRTALVAAAIGGHGDVYEFLIQRGADESLLPPHNPSPALQYAVCCGQNELVRRRLEISSGQRLSRRMDLAEEIARYAEECRNLEVALEAERYAEEDTRAQIWSGR